MGNTNSTPHDGIPSCSVHVEVALEDSLLEVVGLGSLRLLGLHGRSLLRGRRHVGHGPGTVVVHHATSAGRRATGTHREGRACHAGHAVFGTGPKLLGPIEALVISARAAAAGATHGKHGVATKTHPSVEGSRGCGPGLVILDGVLVDGVRIGRDAAAADAPKGAAGGCGTRQAQGGDGQTPALVHGHGRRTRNAGHAGRGRVAALEQALECSLRHRGASLARAAGGRAVISVVGHIGDNEG